MSPVDTDDNDIGVEIYPGMSETEEHHTWIKDRGLLVQVFTSKVILGKDWASGLHSASKRKVLGPEGLVGMDW